MVVFVIWFCGPVLKGICLCRICSHSKGVPQPTVTWVKRGGPLSDNISLLFNGSLLLQNVSLANEGTYVCTATNALGKATAASTLHLLGKCPVLVVPSRASCEVHKEGPSWLVLELRSTQDGREMVFTFATTVHLTNEH